MSIEIKTEDVVKLMLQFCAENGLNQTLKTMQQETQVSLNILDSVDKYHSDISHGRWDLVLLETQKLKVPNEKLMELYEIIVQEMLELGENETALTLVNEAIKPIGLFKEYPERCLRLEYLSKRQKIDLQEIYMDKQTKEKRRSNVADKMAKEVGSAPSSRLLYLLGQALKYQESQGDIKPNIKLNIFTGHIPPDEDEIDRPTLSVEKKIKYGEKYRIECASFSNNGKYLATGSVDGIIELQDPVMCDVDKTLVYQNEENYMLHKDPILSLCFSQDDELLASADKKGLIKVWRVQSGKLLKKIDGVFSNHISCITFGKEFSHLIAASQEIKVIGLKSGKALKEFRGHTSQISSIIINEDSTRIVSGSKDGTIRFWDYKTTECIMNFMPPSDTVGVELDVFNIIDLGKKGIGAEPVILVCNKSDTMNVINWHCQMQNAFSNDKSENFIASACSAHQSLLYGATEKNYIHVFNFKTGKMNQFFKLTEERDEIITMVHHPLKNIVAVFTIAGNIYYLKP